MILHNTDRFTGTVVVIMYGSSLIQSASSSFILSPRFSFCSAGLDPRLRRCGAIVSKQLGGGGAVERVCVSVRGTLGVVY